MKKAHALALAVCLLLFGCLGTGCGAAAPSTCQNYDAPPSWYAGECTNAGGTVVAGRNPETCCWGPQYCADERGNPVAIYDPEPLPAASATPMASPIPSPAPIDGGCNSDSDCFPTGCSGQVCSSQDVITTCEYSARYACYALAGCLCLGGNCTWSETPAFAQCVLDAAGEMVCAVDADCAAGGVCAGETCHVACGGSDHIPCAGGFDCVERDGQGYGACVRADGG